MRKLLTILFLLISTFAGATNYYVKNGGNDGAAGTSDANAWATIERVNSASYSPGDSVLFKCGDAWREYISLNVRSGSAAGRVIYSSYGTGEKPIIYGSKQEKSTDDWVDQGGNIWRNSDAEFDVEVGNLIFNGGTSTGWRVFTTPTSQGRFYYNATSDYVDLYSVGNPATYYSDVECALKIFDGLITIGGDDYVTIDGFHLLYAGRHGIAMTNGASNISIRNCDIEFIGGGLSGSTRLGNGIESYGSATNILIENNYIANVYDSGLTLQYISGAVSVSNWIARNNILYHCDLGLEFWMWNTTGTVNGVYFQNNTCVGSGYGWSHAQKTANLMGYDIYTSFMDATYSNIYVRNNIFSGALLYAIRTAGDWAIQGIEWDYNLFNAPVVVRRSTTNYTTLAQWQAYSGNDLHSVSDNPDFTSSTDFHLTEVSPAIDVALGVGISYDYDWNLRDANPDIGAYEYDAEEPPPPPPIPPTVTTSSVTINFSALTAAGGGNVTSDGEGTVTARGVCWNTSPNPTTSHSKTTDGSGTGAFSSTLTDLVKGQKYYVRAYATNVVGTAYGSNVSFTMSEGSMVFYNGKPVFYAGKPVFYGGTAYESTLDEGIKCYWKFDETEGTDAVDASGNGFTGTIDGATINQTGITGKAYSFDGTDDMVTLSSSPTASLSEVSLSIWVNPDELVAANAIYCETYSASYYYQFAITQGVWYTRDNSTGATGASEQLAMPTLTINDWNHLVFVYSVSGGYKRIYLNGELESESTTSVGTLTASRTDMRIGNDIDGADFDGLMDEPLIYSKALTEPEIADLWNEGNGYQPL